MPPASNLWIFSIKAYLAAMLALYVGFAKGFEYPYWSMMVVYIVALPSTGAIRQKAVYMIGGSATGATLAVLSSAMFATSELSQLTSMAVLAALAAYCALRERLPSFYFFTLAAITCMLVGLPGLTTPDQAFSRGVERLQDVAVGVCCMLVVDMSIFPTLIHPTLLTTADSWQRALRDLCVAVLRGEASALLLRKLLSSASAIDPIARQVRYEGVGFAWTRSRIALAMRAWGLRLLPVLSTLDDLHRQAQKPDISLHASRVQLAEWLENDCDRAQGRRWYRELQRNAHVRPASDATGRLEARCLRRLYASWRQLSALQTLLHTPRPRWIRLPIASHPLPASLSHVDYGYAWLTSAGVLVFFSGICTLWTMANWPTSVAIGLLLGTVFQIVSGLQDDPLAVLKHIAVVLGVAFIIDVMYLTLILPHVSSFATLALVLSPVLLWLGRIITKPGGLLYAILPLALIRLGNTGATVTVDSLTEFAAGLAIGITGAVVISVAFRHLSPGEPARRLRRSNWSDLGELLHSGAPSRHSASGFVGHATDRLILTQSRIAAPTPEDDPLRDDLVGLRSQLDLGLLIQPRHHALAAELKPALQHWLGHRLATPAPETLRQHIDHALSRCIEPHQGTVQAALIDLRLGLFPQAPLTETTA